VALHFRLAPERADEIDHLIKDLAPRVAPALVPIAGKSVVEFKPPTTHKGLAIRAFLEERRFAADCRYSRRRRHRRGRVHRLGSNGRHKHTDRHAATNPCALWFALGRRRA